MRISLMFSLVFTFIFMGVFCFAEHAFYGGYLITSGGETKKVTLKKKDKAIEVNFK